MRKLLIRGGLSLLGTALTLAWWTYGPHGNSAAAPVHYIPAKVGSGGQMLEVDAESTCAATMRVSFERLDKPAGEQILLDSSEKIPAGTKSWTIDVPAGVGGYIELDADHPNPGDTLTMRVHVNGKLADEQTDKLDGPLEPNTAFFVQDHYDDYAKAADQAEAQEPAQAQ
jgi:hypothetical protein